MKPNTVTVDVRDDIRNGLEPFSKIMRTIAALRPDDQLLVIAPFEPVPLYRVMERHGFQHATRQSAADTWEVLFTRSPQVQLTESVPVDSANRSVQRKRGIVELDARGLEPPQPMVTILEALTMLPAGAELHARTDR